MRGKGKVGRWRICVALAVGVTAYLIFAIGLFVVPASYFNSSIPDTAGVGQLLIEILLFPTVIVGFWIAITEFRKSRILPQIKLRWQGDSATGYEDDCLVLETSKYDPKKFYLMLFISNTGDIMTAWYRIHIDVPRELSPRSETSIVLWNKGDDSNWGSLIISPEMTTRYEFKSNGQYALYPGEDVHWATLELCLFPQVEYPSQVQIGYSAVTDKTKIEYGECRIKIRPEDLQKHLGSSG